MESFIDYKKKEQQSLLKLLNKKKKIDRRIKSLISSFSEGDENVSNSLMCSMEGFDEFQKHLFLENITDNRMTGGVFDCQKFLKMINSQIISRSQEMVNFKELDPFKEESLIKSFDITKNIKILEIIFSEDAIFSGNLISVCDCENAYISTKNFGIRIDLKKIGQNWYLPIHFAIEKITKDKVILVIENLNHRNSSVMICWSEWRYNFHKINEKEISNFIEQTKIHPFSFYTNNKKFLMKDGSIMEE